MQRVAILVDDWNLLKAADRLKRRVNLAELAHAALACSLDRYVAFQRFYIGPNSGFGAAQRVERLAEEARSPASWSNNCADQRRTMSLGSWRPTSNSPPAAM